MKVSSPALKTTSNASLYSFSNALASGGSPPLYPAKAKVDQNYLEKEIESVTYHRPEQDTANSWISAGEAQILASRYGQAWNVENYLPKAGAYKISDFAKAILSKFERSDDENRIAGCNPKCDTPGLYLCADGIISAKEAVATSVNGDSLFVTEQKNQPKPDLRPEAESVVLPTRQQLPEARIDHGGETNAAPSTTTKNSTNGEVPSDNGAKSVGTSERSRP